MEHLPGADFPTAGIINGAQGIYAAYKTGRGRVYMRARADVESIGEGSAQGVEVVGCRHGEPGVRGGLGQGHELRPAATGGEPHHGGAELGADVECLSSDRSRGAEDDDRGHSTSSQSRTA